MKTSESCLFLILSNFNAITCQMSEVHTISLKRYPFFKKKRSILCNLKLNLFCCKEPISSNSLSHCMFALLCILFSDCLFLLFPWNLSCLERRIGFNAQAKCPSIIPKHSISPFSYVYTSCL